MSVLAVGMSHRNSPMALLERVALSGEARPKLMADLVNASAVNEAMTVATCNRVEVYADVDRFHAGVTAISELLAWHTDVSLSELTPHLYVHYEERAIQHLFSVTCGLDSMVVGEGQILGQVRDSLKEAQSAGTLGRVLNDLGQRALRVGKRAHTETHLDHAGADMVSLGLTVAQRHLASAGRAESHEEAVAGHHGTGVVDAPGIGADVEAEIPEPGQLTGQRVLVVGAGSMSALAANTVARRGASRVAIANRTLGRARRLAECLREAYEPLNSHAIDITEVPGELATADLVISCTGARDLVLEHDTVLAASHRRTSASALVLLDLALPHDIDPAVRDIPGVELVDLTDLREASSNGTDGVAGRTEAISVVRDIVEEEVTEYQSVRRAELVAPTVVALRSKAATVVDAELERLLGRLPELDDKSRGEISHAMRRIADKLLHQPTVRVKQLAGGPGGGSYEAALRELFDLDPAAADAVTKVDPAGDQEQL